MASQVMKIAGMINSPEDKTVDVAIAIEWVLNMTAVQSMDMEVDVVNLQEVNMETVVPAIGELVAMRVVIVTVAIPKINI